MTRTYFVSRERPRHNLDVIYIHRCVCQIWNVLLHANCICFPTFTLNYINVELKINKFTDIFAQYDVYVTNLFVRLVLSFFLFRLIFKRSNVTPNKGISWLCYASKNLHRLSLWQSQKKTSLALLTSLQKSNSTSNVISSFSMIITRMYRPHCPIHALHCGGLPTVNKTHSNTRM